MPLLSAAVSATHRMDRVQRVGAEPRRREHGQQMGAGRVVDHLAEIRAERGIVHEPAVPLDVREQREVMGEIRSAAGRQKIGTRAPHQPAERGSDDRGEGGERRSIGSGAAVQPQRIPWPRRRATAPESPHGAIVKPSASPR